jgi:farnesyl diphosphate synthase
MSQDAPAPHSMVEPALGEAAAFVERTLDALLPKPAGPEIRLAAAMREAALGPDHRLRAFLVLQAGRLFRVDRRALARAAAAVECVHAYGLAHAFQTAQGGPAQGEENISLYNVFDESIAILAGDALLTFAFGLLGSADGIGDPFTRAELVTRLAQATGHAGMIGGRALEVAFAAAATAPPLPEISRLQHMKTAALITFCCEAGAILGRASPPARHALSAYGQDVGLVFQIASDLAASSDEPVDTHKTTVVGALGVDRAHAQALALSEQAVRHLDLFDEKADLLRAAATFILARQA